MITYCEFHAQPVERVEGLSKVECLRLDPSTGRKVKVQALVAMETPISIYVNGDFVVTLFATPTMLRELAVGHLLGEGVIRSVGEVQDVKIEGRKVYVKTGSDVKLRLEASRTVDVVYSACGSTRDFYSLLDRVERSRVRSDYRLDVKELKRMMKELTLGSKIFRRGGAVHSAAVFEDGVLKTIAEDVGRHNATDKVIGAAALIRTDFSRSVILGTGRQPADLILKAARVGIPISISLRGPVDSGIYAAERTKITLVCLGRGQGVKIYAHPERITSLPPLWS